MVSFIIFSLLSNLCFSPNYLKLHFTISTIEGYLLRLQLLEMKVILLHCGQWWVTGGGNLLFEESLSKGEEFPHADTNCSACTPRPLMPSKKPTKFAEPPIGCRFRRANQGSDRRKRGDSIVFAIRRL